MNNNHGKFIAAAITLFALLSLLFSVVAFSRSTPTVSAKSAALYEPSTKSFVFTKNMNARLPMASTTKIMTALVALDKCDDLTLKVTIDERAVGIEGSSAYFKCGEIYTMIDLLHMMMLRSANDAACQIAYTVAGSIEDFAALMNDKALELGLTDSSFENPNGLDDDNHYTTAHDLAIITAAALEYDVFKDIVSKYKYTATELGTGTDSLYVNHNKMLKLYDGCIGVKTGYTKKSGRSLVSAAVRDGLTLIAVTIDAPNDWQDHINMLNYGYGSLKCYTAILEDEYSLDMPVVGSDTQSIKVTNRDGFSFVAATGGEIEIDKTLPSYLVAPVKAGDKVGSLKVKYNGEVIGAVDIVALTEAEKQKSFFEKITEK